MLYEKTDEKTQQSGDDFFDWSASTTRYAFPTDYALTSLENRWSADRRTIAKYITQNNLFSDLFQHMRYDGDSSTPSKKHSEYNGIPVELEPLFKLYLDKVLIDKQASSIAGGSITKDFDEKLCSDLYQKALIAESSKNSAQSKDLYMFRRLYGNKVFGNYVTKQFWAEFHSRCDALEEITLQQSPEEQMDVLKQVLGFLDILIADLLWKDQVSKSCNESNEIPKKQGISNDSFFMKSFPLELVNILRKRKYPAKVGSDEVAKYSIPNLTIHDDDSQEDLQLKNAFEEIMSSPNGFSKTLTKARDCYMQYIREQKYKEPLQIQCEILQQYIGNFKEPPDDLTLRDDIQQICIEHFRAILVGTPGYVNHVATRNAGERYRFINDVITRLCNDFVLKYQWAISCMYFKGVKYDAYYTVMNLLASGLIPHVENPELDVNIGNCFNETVENFLAGIKSIWDVDVLGEFDIMEKSAQSGDIQMLSSNIAQICKTATEELGIQTPPWEEQEEICRHLGRYYALIEKGSAVYPFVDKMLHDIYLIRAIFTCRIWGEYNRTKKKIYDYYKLLSAYIHNHK